MEMEEMYANYEYNKSIQDPDVSPSPSGPRTSDRRFHQVVFLSLGLLSVLLLAGLIGLGVYYGELNTIKANLAEHHQASDSNLMTLTEERDQLKSNLHVLTEKRDQLTADLDVMTEGRDQLKSNLDALTEERDQLKSNLDALTEERDQLKSDLDVMTKEREQLKADFTILSGNLLRLENLLGLNKSCPVGWTMFSYSCYLFFNNSDSWTKGREDCRNRGSDLVVVDSKEEHDFLINFTTKDTWIGLNDLGEEGTWKWVDGSPLTVAFWAPRQPDNWAADPTLGDEDCVHIAVWDTTLWNDFPCENTLPWICEKSLFSSDVFE